MTRYGEAGYLAMLDDIVTKGNQRMDRTGVGTRALFGYQLRFDLTQGFPLLTTKRIAWRTAFREMLWIIGGGRNIRDLLEQGVHIWSEWPHLTYMLETGDKIALKEFENRVLDDDAFAQRWGDLGPIYGVQFRSWCNPLTGERHDQLAEAVRKLRENPYDRRIIVEGWNVAEIDQMALPPCHKTYQFHVADGKLTTICQQRSCDSTLGVPFNICNAALMTHLIAAQSGLTAGELVWFGCDVHVYMNHLDAVAEQCARTPGTPPQIRLDPDVQSLFDYRMEHIRIEGYEHQGKISAPVAV